MLVSRRTVLLSGLAGATAVARRSSAAESWLGPVTLLPAPIAAPSGQPHLHASAAGTILSWVERRGATATLKFAELADGRWGEARVVASGEDWFVNWADVPSVIRLDATRMAAHWLQRSGPEKYAYDVRLSHSIDGGRTWSPSISPHDDGTKTEHGFATLFVAPGQGLGAVWLDGRATRPAAGHDGHGAGGAMTVRHAAYDGAWRRVADAAIDLRACDCCPTAVAVTSDGPVVAFRDRSESEVRDIAVARLEQGRWTTPTVVAPDGWTVAACPVNGPRLAASGRRVALAWFTAVGDAGHAYVAFSSDAGRTFGRRVRLDAGTSMGRVDLALLDDGTAVATWIEIGNEGAALMVRTVSHDGTMSPAVRVTALEGSRTSGYPRMTRHGDALVFAWTDAGAEPPVVRTATARFSR
ncbi:hypothetical protein TBR22_A14690 [Luteitalea sp. TBR-22]|uniref:sialidase family protein n=1 Tax=Luteitalea sp. TBR-22 TaxID=2802971 RepID=UPI001AF29628|nr:sialidase family protein [Luteitalea sp. TBR-22]BCS32259.1 hypothetical protein TBR22_A14690 [Luteitalea sp. TBR-22]